MSLPGFFDFEGNWDVLRKIQDKRVGDELKFLGVAVWTKTEDGLSYFEKGELHLPAQNTVTATRGFKWVCEENVISVYFADGRFFHNFEISEHPNAVHNCPPDFYEVDYDLSAFPTWSTRWQVKGPRKDYEMLTHYSRRDN